jgi:hypothetical protein
MVKRRMRMNNFWGTPDDDTEPLPDWMNPKTYNQPKIRRGKSIMEAINEALDKPPVPQIPDRECNGFCGEYECRENQANCKRLRK